MHVVLVAHQTPGLTADVTVVEQTLKNHFGEKIEITTLMVPEWITRQMPAINERRISITKPVDVVIFFEHTVGHPKLWAARHRIMVPNPEWLRQRVIDTGSHLTEMWHKTHVSLATLSGLLPNLRHSYIGFTSPDYSGNDPDYDRFIHFKGASIQKQTEMVLAAWQMHPEWPELSVQSYSRDLAFLNFPEWLQWKNIRIRYCLASAEEYRLEVTKAGVHICPSSVEGFGHYINEGRSMGALIVTTNAAPMNELVDDTCGVLITPMRTEKQNFGVRHIIDIAGIERALQTVLGMTIDQRKAFGAKAHQRYLTDRERFRTELINQVLRLARS